MSSSNAFRVGRAATAIAAGIGLAALLITVFGREREADRRPISAPFVPVAHREETAPSKSPATPPGGPLVRVRPAPEFVDKGIDWILKAQHRDGGWGAGSHAQQQNKDPHEVQVDPATTAFVASALLRNGHTPVEGKHQENVRRATEYLCGAVEAYTKPGPKITDLEGTQIQAKLGPLVDTAMTAQYLARVLTTVPTSDPLHARIDKALDKCLAKLQESQQKDGSWNVGGGWASVLQSSVGATALEYAQAAGKQVDGDRLAKAREYQAGNFDAKSGRTKTEAAAGVALYAFNGSLRANAAQANAAQGYIDQAKKDGKLAADAPVTVGNLVIAGVNQPEQAKRLAEASESASAQGSLLNGFKSYSSAAPDSLSVASVAATPTPASDLAGSSIESSDSSRVQVLAAKPSSPVTRSIRAGLADAAPRAAVTDDEALLAGFGNNGGEEFLSYMLASESMVLLGEKDWNVWFDKMSGRLSKVQNPDGSWSGHHCITSPVFCTAAVVQTMTADRDAELLARVAKEASTIAQLDEKK